MGTVLVVQEECSQLGLVQTRPAEVIRRGPIAEQGADSAPAGRKKIRDDAVDGVHSSQARFRALSPLLQSWAPAGPAPSSRELLAGGGNVLLQTLLASCRPLLCGQVAALRPAVPLLRLLHGGLGAGGARSLPVRRPGAWSEDAGTAAVITTAVAEPGYK